MRKIYILIGLIIISAIIFIGGCIKTKNPSQTIPISTIQEQPPTVTEINDLEYIEFSSSNWEALGGYIKISSNGTYISYLERGGIIEEEPKTGKIDILQLNELIRLFEGSNFYSLKEEYNGSRKTSRSWTNYRLTIKSDIDSKSIKFHSEDETAPDSLMDIVNTIENLTK